MELLKDTSLLLQIAQLAQDKFGTGSAVLEVRPVGGDLKVVIKRISPCWADRPYMVTNYSEGSHSFYWSSYDLTLEGVVEYFKEYTDAMEGELNPTPDKFTPTKRHHQLIEFALKNRHYVQVGYVDDDGDDEVLATVNGEFTEGKCQSIDDALDQTDDCYFRVYNPTSKYSKDILVVNAIVINDLLDEETLVDHTICEFMDAFDREYPLDE